MQLAVNLALFVAVCGLLYFFYSAMERDIQLKVDEYATKVLAEITECSTHYLDNRCSAADLPPALRSVCSSWEICMLRNPQDVGRMKVSAETLGEILNSFIEPISLKTMAFLGVVFVGMFVASNMAFNLARRPTWKLLENKG